MTTIKASCPMCGEVELRPPDLTLTVMPVAHLTSSYAFTCPGCQDVVRKPADEHVVQLLVSGGVRPDVVEVPAEALEEHAGPALSYDDLLDLVLRLEQHDDLAALAGQTRTPAA